MNEGIRMDAIKRKYRLLGLLLAAALTLSLLTGCVSGAKTARMAPQDAQTLDTTGFLVAVEDEPDTVDFQCTTIYYTVATNVFNRLVEMEVDENGAVRIVPSLAESWEVSDDGCRYTLHLRPGVRFSNGSPLTAEDVRYTFTRLLTHPDSCNRDIADEILGAQALERGESDRLEGFEILSELDFAITLENPFSAFLACLSMPGASILDQESTEAAGERFGMEADATVGTGSFILRRWERGVGMVLSANPDCWEGPPACAGLVWRFMTEPEEIRMQFERGELDFLDLDDLNNAAEFFLHGDIYRDRLFPVQRIAITYIALNESVKPLDDVRVRKALQLALNRTALLDAVYGGRGFLENGILPRGLHGYNPALPEIPYDLETARALLEEAGYPDGFELTFAVKTSSTQWEMTLSTLVAAMWEKIGVRTNVDMMEESEFMRLRKSGQLTSYAAMWTADFNDPDNFFYTFFGCTENTRFRSLNYADEAVMERVRKARSIADDEARIAEYRELERIIIQEDAAWIPLFSRLHYYVVGERVSGFKTSWNGSVKNNYRYMSVTRAES